MAEKLSPEERKARVQKAREDRVQAAFEGKTFEYVEKVTLADGERYTDVTGNKGRHGHRIRDKATGDEIIVGPSSLRKAQDVYGAITVPEKETVSA